MLRRLAALAPWKRRLIALLAGAALGAGVTTVYLYSEYKGMRRLATDYVAAHEARDLGRLSSLFCWDGVPAAERARIKLALKQELDLPLRTLKFEPVETGEGAPRPTLEGRMILNLKPRCRLTFTFGDAQGAGVTGWLVGRSDEGWLIAVYRPE